MLSDWRSKDVDLERLAKYEDQVVSWLTTEKQQPNEQFLNEESTGTQRLLMRVMMQKLNEKYSTVLNDDQKAIIKAYAWSSSSDDKTSIQRKLVEVRDSLIESINDFNKSNSDNEYVNKKLLTVKEKLIAESLDSVDDDTVTRFMLYVKLNDELVSGDDT
jgi:hypothetical protein